MIIEAKEGGGVKLEPVGNEVITLPTAWPIATAGKRSTAKPPRIRSAPTRWRSRWPRSAGLGFPPGSIFRSEERSPASPRRILPRPPSADWSGSTKMAAPRARSIML